MKNKKYLQFVILSVLLMGCSENENQNYIEHSGTIETTSIIISSQVTGIIDELIIDEGVEVESGDTLAIIEHEKFDLQLEQAKSAKDVAEAQLKIIRTGAREEDKKYADEMLKQAKLNLDQASKNKKRMEKLYLSQAITEKQYDDAMTAHKMALSKYNTANSNVKKIKTGRPEEIEQAEAKLRNSEATIKLLKKNISDCYIVSPIGGQVANRFIEIGESVSYMSSLFKISNLNNVEVKIYVTEKELALIKYGQTAEIIIDAFEDKSFDGKVTFISPEAEFTPKNIQTKSERTKLVFAIKIDAKNFEHFLKPGMPADVRVRL